MSLYETRCGVCGRSFEAVVPPGPPAPTTACPSCQQRRVSRLLAQLSAGPLGRRTPEPCCERNWFGDCGKGGGFR